LVEVNGQIDGELHCTSLILSRKARVTGAISADRVLVNGKVEGPIQAADVVLKSQAHVVGDIHHQTLTIERGAYFEGRSVQAHGFNGHQPDRAAEGTAWEAAKNSCEADAASGLASLELGLRD